MLKVNKIISNDINDMFDILGNEEIYSLDLDNQNIGYGIIRNNVDNQVEVYILKDYQGNGYGSYLFNYLINHFKKDIKLKVDINNMIIRRIIRKNNGIELWRDGHNIYYVIKK